MKPPREPFLGWPGWGLLGEAVLLGTAQTLWWIVIFGSADWLTSQRTHARSRPSRHPVRASVSSHLPLD